MLVNDRPRGVRSRSDCVARSTHASGNGPRRHSWLSAAWGRNKKAIGSLVAKVATGDFRGAAGDLASDARREAGRVINRSGASDEAKAVLTAQADNAINVAAAAAGANPPGFLNPLGVQGQQQIAIGGKTVSVNTLALAGGAIVLLLIVMMVAKR